MFMNIMDGTVVNVALPTLSRSFGVPIGSVSGVVTAYLVTLAVAMPASGWIGDRFGGRNVLLAAITVFTVGVRAVRPRDLAARTGRVPRAAGARRRDPDPRRDDDDHPGVPARRADQGQPGADRPDAARPRARPGDRRRAGRRPVVAVDLLHQPAGRRGRDARRAAVPARRVRAPGRPLRPARLPARRRGLPAGHVRAVDRLVVGLGLARPCSAPGCPGWCCSPLFIAVELRVGGADAAPAVVPATGCSGSRACSSPPPAAGSWARCSSYRCCCRTASASPRSTRPVHLHRGARRHDRRAADHPPVQAGRAAPPDDGGHVRHGRHDRPDGPGRAVGRVLADPAADVLHRLLFRLRDVPVADREHGHGHRGGDRARLHAAEHRAPGRRRGRRRAARHGRRRDRGGRRATWPATTWPSSPPRA